jgi:hypothetical protein
MVTSLHKAVTNIERNLGVGSASGAWPCPAIRFVCTLFVCTNQSPAASSHNK